MLFSIIYSLFFNAYSYAEPTKIGNGGNAVVCYNEPINFDDIDSIKSIELFDYWEYSIDTNYKIKLGTKSKPIPEKLNLAINRLKSIDPVLGLKLEVSAFAIYSQIDSYLKNQKEIQLINDFNPKRTPSHPCYIAQFALQWKTLTSNENRFYISKELFKKSDNNTITGLILHEALYRIAIQKGQNNSDAIRYLNFLIASDNLKFISIRTYLDILNRAKLNIQGCNDKILFNQSVAIKNDTLQFPKVNCFNQKIKINSNIEITVNNESLMIFNDDSIFINSPIQVINNDLTLTTIENAVHSISIDDNTLNMKGNFNSFYFLVDNNKKIYCDKNVEYNIISNHVTGCDISDTNIVLNDQSITITQQIERKNTSDISTYLAGKFNLKISGTELFAEPYQYSNVVIDRNGELLFAQLAKEVKFKYLNLTYSTNYINFLIPENPNLIYGEASEIVDLSKLSEKVLYINNFDYISYCKSINPQYKFYNVDYINYYSGSTVSFYNPKTRKTEYKSNEEVNWVKSINCRDEIYINKQKISY